MTSPAPNPSDVACVLLPQFVLLGKALAPVARNALQAMTCRVRSSGHEFEFESLVELSHHLGLIQQALTHLSPRLDGRMADVIHNKGVGASEVVRVAGRIEQLSEFVDSYLDAMASHSAAEASEARSLILGVYRHHIREICEWPEELVAVTADPASAIQKRGTVAAANVDLAVNLNMTSPLEIAKLDALVRMLQAPPEERAESPIGPQQARDDGPGYWAPSARSPLDSACPKLCSRENMSNQRKTALDPSLVLERESKV